MNNSLLKFNNVTFDGGLIYNQKTNDLVIQNCEFHVNDAR
jgi:hypothetical protein